MGVDEAESSSQHVLHTVWDFGLELLVLTDQSQVCLWQTAQLYLLSHRAALVSVHNYHITVTVVQTYLSNIKSAVICVLSDGARDYRELEVKFKF